MTAGDAPALQRLYYQLIAPAGLIGPILLNEISRRGSCLVWSDSLLSKVRLRNVVLALGPISIPSSINVPLSQAFTKTVTSMLTKLLMTRWAAPKASAHRR